MMPSTSEYRTCFILGVDQRCGTNFLLNLLTLHPDCTSPGPIWEDYFLHDSEKLRDYTDLLYRRWNPNWGVEESLGGPETLLWRFGDAIEDVLKSQIPHALKSKVEEEKTPEEENTPSLLISKTPSVRNVDSFFDFFPNAYLILLVRDGRAVVESGVRSFDWEYEKAMHRWRDGAQTILDFITNFEHQSERFFVVKYEDLVSNQEETLTTILQYLDLSRDTYDFASASNAKVLGSSEIRKSGEAVHWTATEKTADFNPLNRFSNWNRRRHERFNWIAGAQMRALDYELKEFGGNRKLYGFRNRLIDGKYHIGARLKKGARQDA